MFLEFSTGLVYFQLSLECILQHPKKPVDDVFKIYDTHQCFPSQNHLFCLLLLLLLFHRIALIQPLLIHKYTISCFRMRRNVKDKNQQCWYDVLSFMLTMVLIIYFYFMFIFTCIYFFLFSICKSHLPHKIHIPLWLLPLPISYTWRQPDKNT